MSTAHHPAKPRCWRLHAPRKALDCSFLHHRWGVDYLMKTIAYNSAGNITGQIYQVQPSRPLCMLGSSPLVRAGRRQTVWTDAVLRATSDGCNCDKCEGWVSYGRPS